MSFFPEIRALGDSIAFHAKRDPQRLALRWEGRDTTYADLEATSNRLARTLSGEGVQRQQRVIYLGKNSEDFFLAIFAVAKIGACLVPLNWRLTVAEMSAVVADIDAHYAIIDREFEATWNEIAAARRLPARWIDAREPLRQWCGFHNPAALEVVVEDEDPVIVLYTSGTTGQPKGVLHTHGSFNRSRKSEHLEKAFEWRDGDLFLNPLPNFHLLHIALSLQCLYNGVAISLQKQFDPVHVLAAIGTERPTLLVLTPTLIQMLLDHPHAATTDFSSVRMTMYAGSPIALGLIMRAIRAMPGKFMQFYGQTETSGPVCLLRPDEHDLGNEKKLKACGRPLPLIDLRIVDPAGVDIADGAPGELLIKAPSTSAGYWRKPEQTDAQFRSGWYHSGDIAYRDADGLFYIYDRIKDMIITGGEIVYAAEVENAISTHPDVAAVAVVGVPDERWGETVKAIVIPRTGSAPDVAAILAHCRAVLSPYKIPKSIDFVSVFPMTGSGKVSKKELRAPYWAKQERVVS